MNNRKVTGIKDTAMKSYLFIKFDCTTVVDLVLTSFKIVPLYPKSKVKMVYCLFVTGRRSASPAQTVDNLDPNSGQFMRPGSMKAWKVEQDKIREEEEKKRLEKEKKAGRKSARSRSRSASPVKKVKFP